VKRIFIRDKIQDNNLTPENVLNNNCCFFTAATVSASLSNLVGLVHHDRVSAVMFL